MANPANRNALASTLLQLFRGGAPGGDPYANESAGPFANSPRIYGRGQGAPAPVAAAPAPARKPKGGGGGAGKRKAPTGPNNMPVPIQNPMAANATSPSSLLTSPEMNATSPSSLIQSPPVAPSLPGEDLNANNRVANSTSPSSLMSAFSIPAQAAATNPNPGPAPLGLGTYNPLTNAVDQAPRGPFRPTPIRGSNGVPGGAVTPGTAFPGNTGMGPNYADFWRLLQGGSGHGQAGY